MQNRFDFIIVGAGAAGLSLAHQLIEKNLIGDNGLLIIEPNDKKENDRTWCYWSAKDHAFSHLEAHIWDQVSIRSEGENLVSEIAPLSYRQMRGIDFYDAIVPVLMNSPKITWVKDFAKTIVDLEDGVKVNTENETFTANYAFNSIVGLQEAFKEAAANSILLWQPFYGWHIKTKQPVFNPKVPMLMDFDVPQDDELRFMYILPFSENEALLEYTAFTTSPKSKKEYEDGIAVYIQQHYPGLEYEVLDHETGVLPMSDVKFHKTLKAKHIIPIGTMASRVKPSSGYAFLAIQKHTQKLIEAVQKNQLSKLNFEQGRFRIYDQILMFLLTHHPQKGKRIFLDLFKKNPFQRIMRFLNEETTFAEEILIMNSVNRPLFTKAFFQLKLGLKSKKKLNL